MCNRFDFSPFTIMSLSFNQALFYDSNSSVQREEGLNIIKLLNLQKASKVLDVGCGTGYLAKVLSDLVGPDGKVVAIDPDVDRLMLARKKYPAANLEYHEGCAEDLPGGGYDVIFSNEVLHWVKDLDRVFQKAYTALNEGGKFAFNVLSSIKKIYGVPEAYSEEFWKHMSESMFCRDDTDIQLLTSKYNFERTYMELLSNKHVFPNASSLIEAVMAVTHGKFDASHFNVEVLRNYYGDGEIGFQIPILVVILVKKTEVGELLLTPYI